MEFQSHHPAGNPARAPGTLRDSGHLPGEFESVQGVRDRAGIQTPKAAYLFRWLSHVCRLDHLGV